MNKSTKIVLFVSIIFMISVISALSYAYIKNYQTQTSVNTISTLDCLGITMGNQNEYIEINNAYPISDDEGLTTAEPYTFTVTNNCTTPVNVQINLEGTKINENALDLTNIKYAFYRTGFTGYTAGVLGSLGDGTKISSASSSSKNFLNTILGAQEQRSYTLRLWIDENVESSEMGKTYKGKIALVVTPFIYTAIDLPNWNTTNGTLLNAIKNGKYIYAQNMTTPGVSANASNEGIISSALDDYGTSYYFRGRIDDNYVVFANMCWKIVRVTGSDGTNGEYNNAIKLILHNYNPDNLPNPCSQNKNGNAFAIGYDSTSNGLVGKSAFNSTKNSNKYVGYMFGASGTYEAEHTNTNPSTILTNIKKWYDLKLTSYSNYLADVIWCNDKSITSGTGIGTAVTNYGGFSRINTIATATPTLICPDATTNDANYKKISKFTSSSSTDGGYGNAALAGYKIGLITADEVEFAGGAVNTHNTIYYLYESSNTLEWWTMTPGRLASGSAKNYAIQTIGQISNNAHDTNNVYGVRPMIALKNDVTVNTGSDGTATNPYIIQGRLGA